MRESELQKLVVAMVTSRGGQATVIWGGGLQKSGISDVLITFLSISIHCELKVKDGKPTCLQIEYLHETVNAGGIALVAWDVKTVSDILDRLKRGETPHDIQHTIPIPERCNQGVGVKKFSRFVSGHGSRKNKNKSS